MRIGFAYPAELSAVTILMASRDFSGPRRLGRIGNEIKQERAILVNEPNSRQGTNSDFAVLDNFELSTSKVAVRCHVRSTIIADSIVVGRSAWLSYVGKAAPKRCSALVPLSIVAWVQIGVVATNVAGIKELLGERATPDGPRERRRF